MSLVPPTKMFSLLVLFLTVVASTTALPSCPSFANPRTVDPQVLLHSPEVTQALEHVNTLFLNASSTIPSGFIATVVFDQTTVWTQGYGYNDVSNKAQGKPTKDSLVRIASITKVFTTILMYVLKQSNLIALEDPITKYLPNFSMLLAKEITLRELASHTAGMPRELPYPCCAFTVQTTQHRDACNETAMLKILQTKPVMSPTHRRFHYSNLGMAVLGRGLAHTKNTSANVTYEQMVRHYITNPLHMFHATFAYNTTTQNRSAKGVALDGSVVKIPTETTCGFGAPAGCLWASTQDMALLMKFLFRIDPLLDSSDSSDSSGGQDPLTSDTIAEMLAPSVLLRNGYEAVGTPFEMQYILNKYWTKGKQGELPGYRSSLTVIEDLKLGIFTSALITDTSSNSVWTIDALEILAPAFDAALTRLQPIRVLPDNYALYVGKYFDGSVTVAVNGSRLLFTSGAGVLALTDVKGLNYILRAHNEDEIGCRWLDDGSNLELVTFVVEHSIVIALEFMGSRFGKFL